MAKQLIKASQTRDARFPLPELAGTDATHSGSEYAFAVTLLPGSTGTFGTGIALTLGQGNQLVCQAIDLLVSHVVDRDVEELMADFGSVSREMAQHPQLRWLGPHKGVVHLALASITNACFDLWAKTRGVPLWRLLLDLSPEQVVNLLDLSYLEDVFTAEDAVTILRTEAEGRKARERVLQRGYRAYDTSVGWFQYDDKKIEALTRDALGRGFRAFKLKVGSKDPERDTRRAYMLREIAGSDALIMLDANQQWTYPIAVRMCNELRNMNPYFIEEPTHPDDIAAHKKLAEAIAPVPIALGEHVPNRVVFKNFMQAGAVWFVQVDCTRVAGVSEFLTVSLLARKFGLPVIPHIGDMGQIHQHLVLFNHIALGHDALFLEYIPHLRERFVVPTRINNGHYVTPDLPGSSSDLVGITTGNR